MTVFRVQKSNDFSVISNEHLRRRDLSLKAKGLLTQMLSLPPEWDYSLRGLAAINRDGIDSVRSAVRELEAAGYVERKRARDSWGRVAGCDYVVYERSVKPLPAESGIAKDAGKADPEAAEPASGNPTLEKPTLENPTQGKPTSGKPTQGNPTQLNTEESSTDESITKESITNGPRGDPSTTDRSITGESNSGKLTPSPINPFLGNAGKGMTSLFGRRGQT